MCGCNVRMQCEFQAWNSLAGGGGEGWVICETMPFDNGSSDQLQTQDQNGKCHPPPFLFWQDLAISYWWPLASFCTFIQWKKPIKGSKSQWPALSWLHHIQQATPLRRKVHRPQQHTWNSEFFVLCRQKSLLHIVYIFNILCGLEVIMSRRLQ